VKLVYGGLDDAEVIEKAAAEADIVVRKSNLSRVVSSQAYLA
jgi:hypothetical protein